MFRGCPHWILRGIPPGFPRGVPPKCPGSVPPGFLGGVPPGFSGGVSPGFPGVFPLDVPGVSPLDFPAAFPGVFSLDFPGVFPVGVPRGFPGGVPPGLPKGVSPGFPGVFPLDCLVVFPLDFPGLPPLDFPGRGVPPGFPGWVSTTDPWEREIPSRRGCAVIALTWPLGWASTGPRQEMTEHPCPPDLSGEVPVARDAFCAWLDIGSPSPDRYPCAAALMRHALDQQGTDMRGSVAGDTAWEMCCRLLEQPLETPSLGSRQLAQLILYLLDSSKLPLDLREAILHGMVKELTDRGKTVQTEDDSIAMMSRWIKQRIHGELDATQEIWMDTAVEAPVELEVEFEMQEAELPSVSAETEREAEKLLKQLGGGADAYDEPHIPDSYWEDDDDCVWEDCTGWEEEGDGAEQQSVAVGDASENLGDWPSRRQGSRESAATPKTENKLEGGPELCQSACVGSDKPVVDPPEFSDRIRDTDKEPFWIPGAFPTIFQNETGDPHNHMLKEPDLTTWGPHVLRSKGWAAQAHMTFMYWWINMLQRIKTLSAKKWFVRENPKAQGYTHEDLKRMGVKGLAKQMVGYTADIPGTKASKARLRRIVLAMVKQIEIETRHESGVDGSTSLGDVPCLFGTLTSQRYHWDGIISIIAEVEGISDYKSLSRSKRRELVNKYPLFVSWYCAVRLELSLKAIVVPHFGASAYVAVFEWSPTGGMVHLHYILWRPGAPRFDLRADELQRRAEVLRRAGLVSAGVATCKIDDIVDFFSQYVSEWNPNKNEKGVEEKSYIAERVNEAVAHTAAVSVEEMLKLLQEDMSEERMEYYKRSVRTENMHDFHYPDPLGPPNPSQPCAKLLKGTLNMYYCANGYPRDLVCEPCDQSVSQDAYRPDLWRCNSCRNCPLMNNHMPAVSLGTQSNTDAQPVLTRHQAEMYCCKYCSKHTKRLGTRCALYDIMDDMAAKDTHAQEQYGDTFEQTRLGGKLHKVFMAEIGEEMCQAEVAHHANGCPEYFCSRPIKNVHLYKQAVAIAKKQNQGEYDEDWQDWENWDDDADKEAKTPASRKLAVQTSDLALYGQRMWYQFGWETKPSPHLPWRSTPQEQLEYMSIYEFFRFVRFHGGRYKYLSWHDPDGSDPSSMPIVMMSPVLKLSEGPDFAFGARWALIQHHPWQDCSYFLDMEDAAVKDRIMRKVALPQNGVSPGTTQGTPSRRFPGEPPGDPQGEPLGTPRETFGGPPRGPPRGTPRDHPRERPRGRSGELFGDWFWRQFWVQFKDCLETRNHRWPQIITN